MKKIITMLIIIAILFANTSLAATLDKALLYNDHYTKEYLYFENGNKVKTAIIMYNNNGIKYPAYCIERLKQGVGELPSYEVQFKNTMNDAGLWRIVTNSYPYKTPEQMGLSNTDEAYFATKQAIYRYLEKENIDYYAGGIGEEGKRVLNAISKLLDIGYKGKDTYGNINISVEQIGNLEIQEEFFVKECKLKTNLDYMSIKLNCNYKISNLDNGKFKVFIPKSEENPKITLNVSINANTKPLLYGEAFIPENQDYIITGDSYEEISKEFTLNIETPKLGKIKIIKNDNKGNMLPNAKFEILDESNNVVDIITTNEKGEAISRDLKIGKYTIKEIKAPEYYLVSDITKNIEIKQNNEVVECVFENEEVEIFVEIEKTGTKETEPGKEIEYVFPKLKNASNTSLDNLIWIEELPKEIYIKKMCTGTYNQDIIYKVFYQKNGKWRLYKNELSSNVNNKLEFSEKIDKIKIEFGKVDIGFSAVEQPKIIASVSEKLKQGDYFINKTSLGGYYKNRNCTDTSEHTTIIYEKEKPPVVLPKTGK